MAGRVCCLQAGTQFDLLRIAYNAKSKAKSKEGMIATACIEQASMLAMIATYCFYSDARIGPRPKKTKSILQRSDNYIPTFST